MKKLTAGASVGALVWVVVGLILTLVGYFGPEDSGSLQVIGLIILVVGLLTMLPIDGDKDK